MEFLYFILVLIIWLYVEKIMYKKPLTEKEIKKYQKFLDDISQKAKEEYDLEWNYDAKEELLKERKKIKSFILICSGFFIGIISTMVILPIAVFSFLHIILISLNCFFLILLGLLKWPRKK